MYSENRPDPTIEQNNEERTTITTATTSSLTGKKRTGGAKPGSSVHGITAMLPGPREKSLITVHTR